MIEQILLNLAEGSPVALVAVFAIWRLSIVMVKLSEALVEISKKNADTIAAMQPKNAQ